MKDFFGFSVFVVLLTISLIGFFLTLRALFSSRVTKVQSAVQLMPGRALLIGAVNILFFGVIALVLFSIGNNMYGMVKVIPLLPAIFLTGILTIGLAFGLTGMVQMVGERIFPEHSAWKQTLWGTVVLAFACAVPVAGWFLLLPYAALTGFGAFILSFFSKPQVMEK